MSQWTGRPVLITGGAGFIGSQLANHLSESGAKVTVLDDLFTGQPSALHPAVKLYRGTVTDLPSVNVLVKEADVVFHLACRNIIASTNDPLLDLNTNTEGTLNILTAARQWKRKVIYTSSASVYGNAVVVPTSEEVAVPHLLSPYAVSKYAGEGYCRVFFEQWGVESVTLRLSNVYGPGQRPDNPYCGVVSRMLASDTPTIYGTGLQTRDFTYISDAVRALTLAASAPRAVGAVINVGTGVETTVRDLASALHREATPVYAPPRDIDNIPRRCLNVERARWLLRWKPEIGLHAGLQLTREWLERQSREEHAVASGQ